MKNLLLLLLLMPLFLSAQTIDIDLGGGAALPIGNYGSQAIDNSEAGYANMGAAWNVSVGIRLNDAVGINAAYLGTSNPINESDFAGNNGLDGYSVTFHNPYLTNGAVGGFYWMVGNDVQLVGRINAGYVNIQDTDYSVTGNGTQIGVTHFATGAFAFLGGAGIGFKLGQGASLQVRGDYFHTSTEMQYTVVGNGSTINDSYDLTIQNIIIGGAIVFHL